MITAGEGPLSILAGPGSGKTTTLAGRIAYLIAEREVSATTILAITFTTAAAATLRSRLSAVLGSTATHVEIRTFHSFGLKVIRAWSDELGFGTAPPAVYGRDEARALVRQAADELGLALPLTFLTGIRIHGPSRYPCCSDRSSGFVFAACIARISRKTTKHSTPRC